MASIRKPRIFFILCVASTLLLQNCATIVYGTYQKIPATSNPPGAEISVDGEVKGVTPLVLRLKKTKSYVIRIEKEGYNPLDIIMKKEGSSKGGFVRIGTVLVGGIGGYLLAKIAYSNVEYDNVEVLLLPWCIWGLFFSGTIAMDIIGGGLYKLSPAELQVTLTQKEGRARIDLIVINAAQSDNIKWIRIKCSKSQKEELIDLN